MEPEKEYKQSCSSIETTDTNKMVFSNLNKQIGPILHKLTYDCHQQIKSNFYQTNMNYATYNVYNFSSMVNQINTDQQNNFSPSVFSNINSISIPKKFSFQESNNLQLFK